MGLSEGRLRLESGLGRARPQKTLNGMPRPETWGAIRAVFKQGQDVNRATFQKVFASSPFLHDPRAETPSEGCSPQRTPAALTQCNSSPHFVLCCD